MLVPLLHTFHDALAGDKKSRFAESAKKIGSVLLRLGADLFLKYITADAVSLEKLEKIEQTYISERGKLQSEIRNLRRTLQGEMDAIAKKGARVVLFVDDLDRCEPSEIIDVLEAIKLFFDLRHVFILLAVDKEIIDRGIEIRYSKFAFATGRESAIGAEYLEKMVQLPLQLFPLHQTQVRAFIDKMCVRMKSPKDVLERVDLLEKICAPNPRKLKRILNILTVTMAMASKLKPALELEPETIARLVVLQVQSGDLYANVIKNPELLVAMELVFAGKFKLEDDEKFSRFGTRRAVIQKLAKEFHRPDGYLPQIFSGSRFETLSDRLPTYLSLLGG